MPGLIERSIARALVAAGALAAALLFLLVGVIAWNVIARYAFDSSSIGLEELAWHFYATVFLLGISYAVHADAHVRVDLIYEGRSVRTRALIDLVGTLLLLMPFAVLVTVHGIAFARDAYGYGAHADTTIGLIRQFLTTGIGERSQDPGGLLNRFVIKGMIPLGFALLFLAGVEKLILAGRALSGAKGAVR